MPTKINAEKASRLRTQPPKEAKLADIKLNSQTACDTLSTMTYNSAHLPLPVKDASGQTTTLTYNAQGQPLTIENAKSQTTTLAYYSNGYLHTITGPVTGAVTTYTYDSAGRIASITDSEGYAITQAYDHLDRPTITTYPDATTDVRGYNKLDVSTQTDRQGRTSYRYYDAIRQLSQTVDPMGRNNWYTWCTCGGLSTLTDANGHVTTWGLDEQGRVISKTYDSHTSPDIAYVYESDSSRLHMMTDARGSVATYAYNVDDTLSGTTYSLGSGVATTPNVSFTYDSIYNRVLTMADGTGTTTYAYNAVSTGSAITGGGRLYTATVPIAGTTATVTYSYDELGRVTGRTIDSGNSVSTTFDSLGRVTGVTNDLGAFTYAYVDTTSRLSSVTYPSGTGLSTAYSYYSNTGDQRLQTIQNFTASGATSVSRFDYTYNAVGTIATWTQQADSATAIVNTLSYDGADQLTSDVQSGGATATDAFGYDPAGNRLSETTGSGTTAGQFNNLNQLTGIGPTSSQTVSGHTSAAITSATVNAVPATITSSTNFSATVPLPVGTNVVSIVAQPTASTTPITTQREQIVTTGTAPTALTYDANGNTITDENGNIYTWDALNRLAAIVYTSGTYAGTHTEFAYDGLSRRTQIVERAGTTIGSGTVSSTKNYLWCGTEMCEERDATNAVTKRFFPQGEQQSGTSYYYFRDHLGSVREILNSSGTLLTRYGYDSYGRTTPTYSSANTSTPPIDATKQYAGMHAHLASGLYLSPIGNTYDPTRGAWIGRDSLGERASKNLYDYVMNNPLIYFDPMGLATLYYWHSTGSGTGSYGSNYRGNQ